jgi:hypothetical protein
VLSVIWFLFSDCDSDWSKHQIKTNTGNNRASTERCLDGGSENASRVKQSIGGVCPYDRQRARDVEIHLEMCTTPGNSEYTLQ